MSKAAVNLFTNAKADPVVTPEPGKKKSKKKSVAFGAELDQIAAIDALTDALEAKRAILETKIKAKVKINFIEMALQQGDKPANFIGESELATTSCELRKRSTKSVLVDEEIKTLRALGAPIHEQVEVDVPELFYFNQEILAMGPKVLEKISAALSGIKELSGVEIIRRQEPQKKSVWVTTDETIPALCKLKDAKKIEQGLDIAGVLALKPALRESVSIKKAYQELQTLFATETTEIQEA